MMEHTATPWTWDWKLKHDSLEAECGIRHFDGNIAYSVARCPKYQSERQWKADAAFIVKACNNFDEMRHALEMVVRDLDNRQLQSGTICVREIARDVLAKLEGAK